MVVLSLLFAEEYVLLSPVGFKGNVSLLPKYLYFFQGA